MEASDYQALSPGHTSSAPDFHGPSEPKNRKLFKILQGRRKKE